ncbi:flagellum-specific ATP synthase FliI, partial [bacterium]
MSAAADAHRQRWRDQLAAGVLRVAQLPPPIVEGQLTRMVGLTLEAAGCQAAVGDRCEVATADGNRVEAEVVGFAGDRLFLMPTGDIHGLKPSARVIPLPGASSVAVGPELLGRIIDGAGVPLDGRGPLRCDDRTRLTGVPLNPLARAPITDTLDVGVRAINSLLTVGRGQRIGLFAGSGVGKSVLLGMMARYTEADV